MTTIPQLLRRFVLLLLAITATALTAAAYSFMVDGIAYDINPDGKSVTVTYEYEPDYYFDPSYTSASGSLTIPSTVTYSGKTYSVTSIGERAFRSCSGFTGSLTIPNSVTSIGDYAFYWCSHFTAINNHINHPDNVRLGTDVFDGITNNECMLYVPVGSVDEYRVAYQWKDFTNILEGDWGGSINGDVNGDEVVDVDDLNVVINIMVRKANFEDWPAADVDGSGIVDVDDLNHIINIMVHKE